MAPKPLVDLDTVREFFALSPFMADLGVEPVAVAAGTVTTVLTLARRHSSTRARRMLA